LLRQKQKKLIMLPSETMIWQPEFTDKILSRKPGAVQIEALQSIIEEQDEAIRILSYRTDMILNMLSALTAALGGTKTNVYREVVIQQIDKFEKTIPGINAHLAEQEKDHALMAISSVALPKVE
ncbi:hypothetical protein WDJ98_24680, partial [Escherichia coli]